ncbi:BtpA/SgcQ family protein [Candidatus Saccharibacteria bacterium]|nr:BtpA/SgcQ family protein [Candidatus Saccharibacteria bacterium]
MDKLSKSVIGALHLAPLQGYEGFSGYEIIEELALVDLRSFQDGGIDAVIFENNYDLPHSEHITEANYKIMLDVGKHLKQNAQVPLGVNVLWNDYTSALKLAKEIGLDFIRVPVFVDTVKTSYGIFEGVGKRVAGLRNDLGIDDVKIYADIHVKHAVNISTETLEKSAAMAIDVGADGIILTGKWTGDSPDILDLKKVRTVVGDFPIIVGSGTDKDNIRQLFEFADAAIVSTSLKEGQVDVEHTNLASWEQRISAKKVREFMDRIKGI